MTKVITLAERRALRQQYLDLAVAMARHEGRSMTCTSPDISTHTTCAGLEAVGPLGCLCECHDFEWLTAQLATIAAQLEGPITAEQWTEVWVDTRNALREEGESEANAAVLADHHVVEHFGPRP